MLDKVIMTDEVGDNSDGFTVTKFAIVAGSIALVLFGLGYTLRGFGEAVKPVGKIINTFHDSDSSDSSDSSDTFHDLNSPIV